MLTSITFAAVDINLSDLSSDAYYTSDDDFVAKTKKKVSCYRGAVVRVSNCSFHRLRSRMMSGKPREKVMVVTAVQTS